jgi:hypothetical protein
MKRQVGIKVRPVTSPARIATVKKPPQTAKPVRLTDAEILAKEIAEDKRARELGIVEAPPCPEEPDDI